MARVYYRINADLLNVWAVQSLSPYDFKEQFMAALRGEPSAFSGYVLGPYSRPLAHEWRVIRDRIFRRDDFTCGYCGAKGVRLECDHIVPVAAGGSHDDDNLLTACKPCNRKKAAKSLSDLGWA